jgi:hypothetical protein
VAEKHMEISREDCVNRLLLHKFTWCMGIQETNCALQNIPVILVIGLQLPGASMPRICATITLNALT